MKKRSIFFLILVLLLTLVPQPLGVYAASGYFPSNTAASGYVSNLCLLYTGYYSGTTYEGRTIGTYDKDILLPYVGHYNENNVMDDIMFDSFLFLGIFAPGGKDFTDVSTLSKCSTKTEWDWYINRLFTANQQLDALNQATFQAASALGLSNYKSKVYIMIPFPNDEVTDFGDVDGDGISENLNSTSGNMYKVCKWYIDTIKARWDQANYSNLELTGFYWMHEDITPTNVGEVNAINSSGNYLHTLGLKFFWCPWSQAPERNNWSNYSFDFCIQQPNHYFYNEYSYATINRTAAQARTYNEGVEIEFDERVMFDSDKKYRFYNYLKGGFEYGYMTESIKGWYQGVYDIYNLYKNRSNSGTAGVFDGRQMYHDIYKFIKHDYSTPGNLAYKKPVYASSIETNSFTPDKAVDNFIKTRWSSQYSDSQWIYVDLGQAYNVNGVRLNWEAAYGKGYKIQVSNNASTWIDVYSTTTGDGGVDDITFSPVSARYVRIYGTQRGTTYGYSLFDFEVFDVSDGTTPVQNLAFNKTISSSSYQSAAFTADNAADGSSSTRWASQTIDSQWIYVDLGKSYNVNRVILNWEAAYGKSYKIQVSNDAANWTDVYSTTTGNGGINDISFPPVSARYVRMYGVQRGTIYGYSLYEFQVFDKPNLALNKPVTSSSNERYYLTPDKAVDGNSSTRWASLYTVPQWIQVDLGQPYSINRVKLNWEAAYGKGYKIQASNDGTAWTDVYATSTGDGGTDDILFALVNTRYVRMYGIQGALAGYGFSLFDFEVYGN